MASQSGLVLRFPWNEFEDHGIDRGQFGWKVGQKFGSFPAAEK